MVGCTRIQVLRKCYFGLRRLTLGVSWDQVKALGFSHPLGKGHLLQRGPIPFSLTTFLLLNSHLLILYCEEPKQVGSILRIASKNLKGDG